eukprot:1137613-Pelagomonas_calceolata.AAC.3
MLSVQMLTQMACAMRVAPAAHSSAVLRSHSGIVGTAFNLKSDIFGTTFDLDIAGAGGLPKDILIPGVAVFSRRALPLAAWTSGLEIAAVKADVQVGARALGAH